MSLVRQAVDLVKARGSATVDALMPHFPGHTREQVRRALKAAADMGLINAQRPESKQRPHRATGRPKGAKPTVYKPVVERTYRRVASVFELAAFA